MSKLAQILLFVPILLTASLLAVSFRPQPTLEQRHLIEEICESQATLVRLRAEEAREFDATRRTSISEDLTAQQWKDAVLWGNVSGWGSKKGAKSLDPLSFCQ